MSVATATNFSVAQLNAAIKALGGVPVAGDEQAEDALSTAWGQFVTLIGTLVPNSLGAGGVELPTFADNAAAVLGGLAIGQFYRITGADTVAQVHA